MKRRILCTALLLSVSGAAASSYLGQATELKGPIDTQGTSALPDNDAAKSQANGALAPGADAVMTPDLLMVNPRTPSTQAPQPLTAYIGMAIKIEAGHDQIILQPLRGLVVTVSNDTNRPLSLDGDMALAKVGDKSYASASLTALQLAINPNHGAGRILKDAVTKVTPAAVTIGAEPTVKDMMLFSKPVLQRYGTDEERRRAESSRFGKRILWPHEKTQGVVYFQTDEDLASAKVEIPVSTLFDTKDTGTLISSP